MCQPSEAFFFARMSRSVPTANAEGPAPIWRYRTRRSSSSSSQWLRVGIGRWPVGIGRRYGSENQRIRALGFMAFFSSVIGILFLAGSDFGFCVGYVFKPLIICVCKLICGINTCVWTCVRSIDMCVGRYRHMHRPVHRHVHRHVRRCVHDVYRRVYGHL